MALKLFLAFMIGSVTTAATAVIEREMTAEEKGALPAWCAFTMSFDRTMRAPGHFDDHVARYGEGWNHVHHYCRGLVDIMRYYTSDPLYKNKSHWANSAIGEIDYVLRNAPGDFLLNKEMLFRKVRLQISERKFRDAEKTARDIVQRWPEAADSHGALAEALIGAKQHAEAKRALEAASAIVKDGQRLTQIKLALGL